MNPVNSRRVDISIADAEALARTAFTRAGVAPEIAARVASDLMDGELEGYPSHGLLRVDEYLRAIATGAIRPAERASIEWVSPSVATVDGSRGFGCDAADRVAEALVAALEHVPVAAVALRNANHIGRLAGIGEALASSGHAVLGFCNYLGAGQKVLPYGGAAGRLCTNPVLFACPRAGGNALVIDLTTSVVAEGRVRAKLLAGEQPPPGWLLDADWNAVTEGERLYETPPSAFLAPLGGGEAGYKGFALALIVEILAGVMAGAGFARPGEIVGGNGGLFIGLRPGLFGTGDDAIQAQLEMLLAYVVTDVPPAGSMGGVRIPGDRARAALAQARRSGIVSLPEPLIVALQALAGGRSTP